MDSSKSALLSSQGAHPVILPRTCALTKRLVEDTHKFTLHGLPQLMCSVLRSFWITRGYRLFSGIYQRCPTCIYYSSHTAQQQKGQLPPFRITPSQPLNITGLDNIGPIPVRFSKGRGAKSVKGYLAIFVCVVTRTIHIEVVSDLTTDSFLAAFARFCLRRGTCSLLLSDNATTFVGATNELTKLFKQSSEFSTKIRDEISKQGVQWKFIPPHAPHFGGL
ncbi:uncharacterized protein LOC106640010 [Copidosoma floridanum]|uniref:uncharacterized protein LOC106640010 n=1 Tax=Copidosoma floridanum TaxID=29053 RepID=UPI0006C9DBC8|nr:uncharacterized protein LOC106640010 [Copidosoma floridanum]